MLVVDGSPRAIDVVLAVDPYGEAGAPPVRPLDVFGDAQLIDDDLWLCRLDHDLTEAILDACERRGEHFTPTRQYGSQYAFVRARSPEPERLAMDPDGRLYVCIALSRLVHPTAIGYSHAARVRLWPNGARQIIPRREEHLNANAFVAEPATAWLNPSDAGQIGDLVRAYYGAIPTGRVHSALWYFEAAARSYYFDQKWTLLVSGLESLVHIRSEPHPSRKGAYAGSTKVFVDRLSGMSSIDPAMSLSASDARAIYEARSHVAHGGLLVKLQAPHVQLYLLLEAFARAVLRKTLLDVTFRSVFADDKSLARALPLRP